jgi:phosphoribosylanthranilate isomerase
MMRSPGGGRPRIAGSTDDEAAGDLPPATSERSFEVLVKICGLTRSEDARMAIAAGADMIGFVFVPGTPRGLDPSRVDWILGLEGAARVGVFRDAELDELKAIRDGLGLDWVQLHGEEPEYFVEELGPRVLRRVIPRPELSWDTLARIAEGCLPLLDPGGGDGVAWDWQWMGTPPEDLHFGLAGGLDPHNVSAAIRLLRPRLVDVSSGVERAPGIKDLDKLTAFVRSARAAAEQARRAPIE